MTSSRIEELKQKKQKELKKRKSQTPYAIGASILALLIFGVLFTEFRTYSIIWIIGIGIGITLQRSRFCFVASVRNPIIIGSTSLLKAVLISLMISTIGFLFVQYDAIDLTKEFLVVDIPGQVKPVGIHTVLGGIIFGIGMVIAGGCASGTLVRIGEGFKLQWMVLVGLIIGSVLGANHFDFWNKILFSHSKAIYLPSYFGFFGSLLLQLLALGSIYFVADWYGKRS